MVRFLAITLFLALAACVRVPENVTPVTGFELSRYLGTWYEIARLDHRFERGLVEVTAEYHLRGDGGINVINKGRDSETGEWNKAEGKAYFIGKSDVGRLKVSFFGPFYGSYNIAMLDDDYTMALVIGPTLDYAWLLSRDESPARKKCNRFLDQASQLGISRERWIQIRSCEWGD